MFYQHSINIAMHIIAFEYRLIIVQYVLRDF